MAQKIETFPITRRNLLRQTATMMACSAAMAHLPGAFAESLANLPQGGSTTGIPFPRRRAQILPLDAVHLENGPYREAMERNGAYVLSLAPDKFLYYFRTTAGLQPKADAYGGWEEKVGRMLGHYLSACSMYFRATGNPEFQQRQNYVVDELARLNRIGLSVGRHDLRVTGRILCFVLIKKRKRSCVFQSPR